MGRDGKGKRDETKSQPRTTSNDAEREREKSTHVELEHLFLSQRVGLVELGDVVNVSAGSLVESSALETKEFGSVADRVEEKERERQRGGQIGVHEAEKSQAHVSGTAKRVTR